jgi:phosphoglycolate phosphatase-like HAD superfamily hydrolase
MVMVGDSTDDVQCGAAAGATAVLIGEGLEPGAREAAHFHVQSLSELVQLLQREFLVSSAGGAWPKP